MRIPAAVRDAPSPPAGHSGPAPRAFRLPQAVTRVIAASGIEPSGVFSWFAAAGLFVLFGRLFELTLPQLRLTGLIYGAALIVALLTGGAYVAASHRVGRFLVALYVWMVIALPFSIWKGGSFTTCWVALKSAAIYLIAAGLIRTAGDYRRAARGMAFSVFTISVLASVFSVFIEGRLTLPAGRFANPNDLANAVVIGLPFCLLFVHSGSGTRGIYRLLAFATAALAAATMLRTGSRGALVGFIAACLVFLLRSRRRVMGALVLILLCVVALAFTPERLRTRYLTFFSPPSDQPGPASEAVESAAQRKLVLAESLAYTFTHPLFGVGPGMFSVFQDQDARERGQRRGHWLVTHNTYTQISSECGIPAFLFYMTALIFCLRITSRHRRAAGFRGATELATAALCLNVALVTYSITSFFGSIGYSFLFPALAGLSVGLDRAVEAARAAAPPERPAPALPSLRDAAQLTPARPVG